MIFCLDLVYYKPTRKVAFSRSVTVPAVAITNYDRCGRVYWLIGEVDGPLNPDWVEKNVGKIVMVMKTVKGYHVYLHISDRNPLKVIHAGYKLGLDRGHLKLGRLRESKKLILRVWGKYPDKPWVAPVLVNEHLLTPWHAQVLELVRGFLLSK